MGDGIIKAAILYKQKEPLIVDEIRLPESLECGQVLVKVCASGICGKQIDEISGAVGEDKYLPHLLGHEGGGIVIKCGPCVNRVKEGDRVVLHWRKGGGIESNFPVYKWRDGSIGGGLVTTFNEYAVISENRLTAIPDDITFEIAALMGCSVTTGLGIVNNEAKLKMGESIAVIGCGGVGLNVIQGAAMVSANKIIAIDIHEKKLKMAEKMGANFFVCVEKPENCDLSDWINKISDNRGVDVVVECTGRVDVIEQAFRSISSNGGRLILVGQPRHDEHLIFFKMRQHYCGKTVMDSQGGLTMPNEDIPRYLKLYRSGKLKLDKLITHRFKLKDINKALDVARSADGGKCIINMN